MRVIAIMLVLLFAGLSAAQEHGGYSRLATPIWGTSKASLVIKSPDGTKSIVVERKTTEDKSLPKGFETSWQVAVKANRTEYATSIGDLVDSEVAWSPDSKAFFVTYSDGGNVGTFHVQILWVDNSGLRVSEPVPDGRKLLVPICLGGPEIPNVGAIRWLKDSSRLLIAVEVPPHSSCASMGTFRAYEITVPEGKVIRQHGQLRAKALFAASLGQELLAAEDGCVRHPETCVPNGLSTGTGRRR